MIMVTVIFVLRIEDRNRVGVGVRVSWLEMVKALALFPIKSVILGLGV